MQTIRTQSFSPRIPVALQSVILASNRGDDVLSPPPLNVASKVFPVRCGFYASKGQASSDDSPRKRAQYMFPFRPTASSKPSKEDQSPSKSLKFASPRRTKSNDIPVPLTPLSTLREESKALPDSSYHSPAKESRSAPRRTKSSDTPKKSPRLPSMSPQTYLDALMSNRGYSTERISAIDTAYRNTPTALQKASYQGFLINIARSGDLDALADMLTSGLSPNPCNLHGESLCHLVCRLGKSGILQTMLDCGTSLDVCDDYGRTPLHDACWAAKPAFDVVDLIMTASSGQGGGANNAYHLFTMVDNRGSTPLSYIRQEHWAQWMQFLQSKKDVYWPVLDKSNGKKAPPPITTDPPHSRPCRDPVHALPTDLAIMVASGSMSPIEAKQIVEETRRMDGKHGNASLILETDLEDLFYDDSSNDDDEDDDYSATESDCDNDASLCSLDDDVAMAGILKQILDPKTKSVSQ